jgi:hypothetical protein
MAHTASMEATSPLGGNALPVAISGAIHQRGRPTHARSPAAALESVTIWTCRAGGGVRAP